MVAWTGPGMSYKWVQSQAKAAPRPDRQDAPPQHKSRVLQKQVWVPRAAPTPASNTAPQAPKAQAPPTSSPKKPAAAAPPPPSPTKSDVQQTLQALLRTFQREAEGKGEKTERCTYGPQVLMRFRWAATDAAPHEPGGTLRALHVQGGAEDSKPTKEGDLRAEAPVFCPEDMMGAGFFPMVPPWPFEAFFDPMLAGGMMEGSFWPDVPYAPQAEDAIGKQAPSSRDSTHCDSKAEGSEAGDLESATAASTTAPASPQPHVQLCPPDVAGIARELQARHQIEYYFSTQNLVHDKFLRGKMDKEGWVSLEDIVQFPRMQRLLVGAKEAAASLLGSAVVEVTWEPPAVRLRSAAQRAAFPHIEQNTVVVPG